MAKVDVTELLAPIGFRAPAITLCAFLEHALHSKPSPIETIEKLVESEQRERESRNLASRTRMATLEPFSTLDHFDWNHPRKIDRNLFESLHGSLDFIDRGEQKNSMQVASKKAKQPVK